MKGRLTLGQITELPPTLTVEQAGEICGVSRGLAFEQARRFLESGGEEGIPAVRLGRRIVIPTVHLLELVGLADIYNAAHPNGQANGNGAT